MAKKQRTKPPRVDNQGDHATSPVPSATENSEGVRYVTLTIPVVLLSDVGGYQESLAHPPRQLRSRRLDSRQGIALGSLRLGLIATGATFDVPRYGFETGVARRKEIETKEETIAKLLEIIAGAIADQAGD